MSFSSRVIVFQFCGEYEFTKMFQLLKKPYRDKALGRMQRYEWFTRFKSDCQSAEDDPIQRRPSTSTDQGQKSCRRY